MTKPKTQTTRCAICGEPTPDHRTVQYGSQEHGSREVCTRCMNADMAERCGLDFEHVELEPVTMTDCSGKSHEFHFATHLLGDMMTIDAFELHEGTPCGHEFQVIGSPDDEPFDLMAQLIERIRRALSVSYLSEDPRHGLQIAGQKVCGQITCDLDDDAVGPAVVIDGREISWEEFGRMLGTFEGFHFRLEIVDRSEAP